MIGTGVLLALLASLMYGTSNVLSGLAVRRHATASLALWAQTTGLLAVGLLALVRAPTPTGPGLAWGISAGAVGALAVLTFYSALQRGRTAVVASVSGAGVVVPVLTGFAGGDPFGWRAGAGVLAAVAGVLIVALGSGGSDTPGVHRPASLASRRPAVGTPGRAQSVPAYDQCVPARGADSGRSAVWLAVASALGFGGFFVVLKLATTHADHRLGTFDTAVVVSLAVQAGALAVTLVAATRHTRACVRPRRALLLSASAIGLLDVGGDVVLTVAVRNGPLSVIGPLGSLAPVVAVVLATVLLRERLRRLPLVGVLVALAGIVLIASG